MLIPKYINFNLLGDDRGSLIALEVNKEIPFVVRRVYFILDTKEGVRRGFHAHKTLNQIAFCVTGSCTFLLDDGNEQVLVDLDSPHKGLYIGPDLWREISNFSENCALVVIADQEYDESDYIRSHSEFLNYINQLKLDDCNE